MKKVLLVVSLHLSFAFCASADFLVQPNDVVGIGGDSITEQHIYSAFIEDYLLMCQPTQGQKVVQFGWSGEAAGGFLARLDTDVFPFHPTVMTTCYGMNDGRYAALTDDTANTYRTAQTGIIEALKKNGIRVIVLGSPKCVDSHFFQGSNCTPEVYNKTLGALAGIDKEIALKEGVIYADVFGITLDVMKKAKAKFGEDYNFAGTDGIHPGANGHLVMAYAFLKALGCDGNIGTITVDVGTNRATGTPGQEIVSDQGGVVTIKSTRYPFCFLGDSTSKDPNFTGLISTVFPFNDDLNRYMLVVKGLTTAKAKVTWGGATKEYASADLAKGINLAAEFLNNPFAGQFGNVHVAVQAQESQESLLNRFFMHNADQWGREFAPGTSDSFNKIIEAAMMHHNALFKQAADLVIPIQHTIKIEPIPNP